MATNLMVEANSALSKEVKLSTLSEEVSRRLRNTSPKLNSSRRLEILEKACVQMKTSGHSEKFIRLAVEQGIRSFDEKSRGAAWKWTTLGSNLCSRRLVGGRT